jgi:hypothetical protein
MTQEHINKLLNFFNENEDTFIEVIEEMDNWNGYLDEDRYYHTDEMSEIFANEDPVDLLHKAFNGRDEDTNEEFNPNREFFRFNGYGNLLSSDYKDYSDHLNEYFVNDLFDLYPHLYLDNLPELVELIEEAIKEDGE